MKQFVMILGPHAVGKMTVGQELAAMTGLKLLHNHMTIDLVSPFFRPSSQEGRRLTALFRRELCEAVAKSDLPGLIFTYMLNFGDPVKHDYVRSLLALFADNGARTCVVELCADIDVRLERNKTENRLRHKPSKRDIPASEELFRRLEVENRLNSRAGEVLCDNYMKIDNTHLSPAEVAALIQNRFDL